MFSNSSNVAGIPDTLKSEAFWQSLGAWNEMSITDHPVSPPLSTQKASSVHAEASPSSPGTSACHCWHFLYASLIPTQQQKINSLPSDRSLRLCDNTIILAKFFIFFIIIIFFFFTLFFLQQAFVLCLCFVCWFSWLVKIFHSLHNYSGNITQLLPTSNTLTVAAWCEPCQDKQTWHIKQENESLLLSHQNKSGKH